MKTYDELFGEIRSWIQLPEERFLAHFPLMLHILYNLSENYPLQYEGEVMPYIKEGWKGVYKMGDFREKSYCENWDDTVEISRLLPVGQYHYNGRIPWRIASGEVPGIVSFQTHHRWENDVSDLRFPDLKLFNLGRGCDLEELQYYVERGVKSFRISYKEHFKWIPSLQSAEHLTIHMESSLLDILDLNVKDQLPYLKSLRIIKPFRNYNRETLEHLLSQFEAHETLETLHIPDFSPKINERIEELFPNLKTLVIDGFCTGEMSFTIPLQQLKLNAIGSITLRTEHMLSKLIVTNTYEFPDASEAQVERFEFWPSKERFQKKGLIKRQWSALIPTSCKELHTMGFTSMRNIPSSLEKLTIRDIHSMEDLLTLSERFGNNLTLMP